MVVEVKSLPFANASGDRIRTRRVRLDVGGPTYVLVLDWLPLADEERGAWALTMTTTNGNAIVSGALLRDRTDAINGITPPLRPVGAIIPYNATRREDPRRFAFEREGWRLLYVPSGYDPGLFTSFTIAA